MTGKTNAIGAASFGHTVDFISDNAPYAKYIVTDGQTVSAPNVNPTSQSPFLAWYQGGYPALFPLTPSEDTTLSAVFGNTTLLNPTMTSNTTPSGVCFAINSTSGRDPYMVFRNRTDIADDTEGSATAAHYFVDNTAFAGAYLGYDFGDGVQKHIIKVVYYVGFNRFDTSKYIKVKIQGSNDNSQWTDISHDTDIYSHRFVESNTRITKAEIPCFANNAYRYIRLYIISSNSGELHSFATHSIFNFQLEFYGLS